MALEFSPIGGLIRLAVASDLISLSAIRMHYEQDRPRRKLMFRLATSLAETLARVHGSRVCGGEAVAVVECKENGVVGYMNVSLFPSHGIVFEPMIHPHARNQSLEYHLLFWYMQRCNPQRATAFSTHENAEWLDLLRKFDFAPAVAPGPVQIFSFNKMSRMDSEIGDACR